MGALPPPQSLKTPVGSQGRGMGGVITSPLPGTWTEIHTWLTTLFYQLRGWWYLFLSQPSRSFSNRSSFNDIRARHMRQRRTAKPGERRGNFTMEQSASQSLMSIHSHSFNEAGGNAGDRPTYPHPQPSVETGRYIPDFDTQGVTISHIGRL